MKNKTKLHKLIIAVLFIVIIAQAATLAKVGYFTNSCVNLKNICNYYIDDDKLHISTRNIKNYDDDGYIITNNYIIEYLGDGLTNIMVK